MYNVFRIHDSTQHSSPQLNTNLWADQCPQMAGSTCTCYNTCYTSDNSPCHHSNITKISDELYAMSRQYNEIITLWTNRPKNSYCEFEAVHIPINAFACVVEKRPVIHYMHLPDATTKTNFWAMSIILAHETAHVFKMDDVYDSENHKSTDSEWLCVMGYYNKPTSKTGIYYSDVLAGEETIFCDNCFDSLLYNIDAYDINLS